MATDDLSSFQVKRAKLVLALGKWGKPYCVKHDIGEALHMKGRAQTKPGNCSMSVAHCMHAGRCHAADHAPLSSLPPSCYHDQVRKFIRESLEDDAFEAAAVRLMLPTNIASPAVNSNRTASTTSQPGSTGVASSRRLVLRVCEACLQVRHLPRALGSATVYSLTTSAISSAIHTVEQVDVICHSSPPRLHCTPLHFKCYPVLEQ